MLEHKDNNKLHMIWLYRKKMAVTLPWLSRVVKLDVCSLESEPSITLTLYLNSQSATAQETVKLQIKGKLFHSREPQTIQLERGVQNTLGHSGMHLLALSL